MDKMDFILYLNKNFNMNKMAHDLIYEFYDLVYNMCGGYDIVQIGNKRYKIQHFIGRLIYHLNNANIDVTINELIENGLCGEEL